MASKLFLITIGDRTVGGLVARDQLVGPWQVPVADVAATSAAYGFDVVHGEAMAMGERTPVAIVSPAASARLAVAESLTNLAAAHVVDGATGLARVKLSANWMAAASHEGEGAALYAAVRAIGMELCPQLGLSIPVGKDSMSMATRWSEPDGRQREVVSPLSLIVTAFAPVENVNHTWTPELRLLDEPTVLVLVDLAQGRARMGGSALAQVFRATDTECPDVDEPAALRGFWAACQALHLEDIVLAYHDRSDGGLFVTVAEMAFAGHLGVTINVDALPAVRRSVNAALFAEELGAVFQVRQKDAPALVRAVSRAGVATTNCHVIGSVEGQRDEQVVRIVHGGQVLWAQSRAELQAAWAETSYRMQALRDNPDTARQEFEALVESADSPLGFRLTFDPAEPIAPERPSQLSDRPRVAVLREQGVNGHMEMAWAFTAAGFAAVDVHMTDLLRGEVSLDDFVGLAACGGFSYGDVLGAGNGWASSILLNGIARTEFERFFLRPDTFALAVCNGCQLFARLRALIPGASSWPVFKPNASARYEARVCTVRIEAAPSASSPSVFLRGMHGSRLPIVVAHGEGRVVYASDTAARDCADRQLIAMRFVDGPDGPPTERYPANPNGSPDGATAFQTIDGRVLALMPHPERTVTRASHSWHPDESSGWAGRSPWFRLFVNARQWIG